VILKVGDIAPLGAFLKLRGALKTLASQGGRLVCEGGGEKFSIFKFLQ